MGKKNQLRSVFIKKNKKENRIQNLIQENKEILYNS